MVQDNRSGVFTGPRNIHVESRPVPVPEPGGIVVQVSACGICGSDMHIWRDAPAALPLPIVLGHEFSGRVSHVGENVVGIEVGARVAVNPILELIGIGGGPGAFAQYVSVKRAVLEQSVFLLPDEMSDEDGALVEPLAVALHAINRAEVKPGDKVAIFGAGPIGLCVLAALKARGMNDVAISDVQELRLSMARGLGAGIAIDGRSQNVVEVLQEQFGSVPIPFNPPAPAVDVVFECAGTKQSFETAMRSVRQGGKMVYVAAGHPVELDVGDFILREIALLGTFAYADEFPVAIELMRSKKVDLRSMLTQRFPLEALAEAFQTQADTAKSVKTIVSCA